jgi:hypothetical protein
VDDPKGLGAAPSSGGTGWEMSARQRMIFTALGGKHARLAAMYAGACHVLVSGNPDHLALAAHSIRELIEKLPDHVDVPAAAASDELKQPKKLPSLKDQVIALAQLWRPVAPEVEDATEINGRIRKFHRKLREFFERFEQDFPNRRAQRTAALRKLDGSGRPLPPPIENHRVAIWGEYNDFFQGVSHHSKACTEEEFLNWLDSFEGFLVDCLCPRTFDIFAELDAIIEEGEQDA